MADGHDLAMGLRAAYLTMHRRANSAFARHGVTADQFVLLTTLAERAGVSQKELAGRTHSDPNTVSERLGRLERLGLVVRERHPDDGRAYRVSLSGRGRELQARLWAENAAFRATLAGLLPADALDDFVGHLRAVARAMSAPDDPP